MSHLSRFIEAQGSGVYHRALEELRAGAKRSHWMWFIFPQVAGLGRSETARYYALADREAAADYARHAVLGPRLATCTDAILDWRGKRSAEGIMGPIDALKFRSSMTLFGAAAPDAGRFSDALDAFYEGLRDLATVERL